MDWNRREIIASTPIQSQKGTHCCWAYGFADTTGTTYAINNPCVNSQMQFRCSPQDLSDWVCFVQNLQKDECVDQFGTYRCKPKPVIDYLTKQGVSLLENYPVKIEKQKLKTYKDKGELKKEFQAMRKTKGPRIFIKEYDVLYGEASTGILSIDAVFKFLHTGVVYAVMYYCKGCSLCKGFSSFDGSGVYDEPSHPEDHKYVTHAVMVLGQGNKDGKNYLRIRNSHGYGWPTGGPRPGCGDVHIKFFKSIYQVKGVEKKEWTGKKWVSSTKENGDDVVEYKSHCDVMPFKELVSDFQSSLDQAVSNLKIY